MGQKLIFKTDYHLMHVKSIAECSILLSFVIKIFVLSIFEWPLKTSFTVCDFMNARFRVKKRGFKCQYIGSFKTKVEIKDHVRPR